MKDFLKVYRARLHILSPTFIGSGKEISKKEYRLLFEDRKIAVYDPGKFYLAMKQFGKAAAYEEYLLDNRGSDLNYWMEKYKISDDMVAPAVRYCIDWGDRMDLGKSKNQIMEFIKDPYGNPYVPGTSIKGMLRTILLGYEISRNRKLYSQEAGKIESYSPKYISNKNYQREANAVENKAFKRLTRDEKHPDNAVNDILQGLIVSDSKPLSVNDLVLCQKIDYHTDSSKKPLNILRESLKPGVDVEFTISIDSTVCKYDADTILEAISSFNDMYYDEFSSKFGIERNLPSTVYLGGGVGFVSKTFIYHMFRGDEGVKVACNVFKNTLHEKIYITHKHGDDKRRGVSPHVLKCTNYNGKCFQVGMSRFEIEPL